MKEIQQGNLLGTGALGQLLKSKELSRKDLQKVDEAA